jgi:hypothetical protein
MKKKILPILVYISAIGFVISMYRSCHEYDEELCDTVKIPVKGVIIAHGASRNYHWIEVDNLKQNIYVQSSDIKNVHGLSDSYIDIEVGDSIIKKAKSREFIIKRKDKYGIYELDCN